MAGIIKVAEVLFNNLVIITFVLYTQLELFFFLCYNPIILLNKALKLTKANQVQVLLISQNTNTPYFFLFFFLFFFIKSNSINMFSLFTFSVIYLFKVSQLLEKTVNNTNKANNIIYLVLPTFISFLYLLIFIKSLLTFFFFIEIYGVLYYFLFLTSYQFTNQTILKYKNGLLFLL